MMVVMVMMMAAGAEVIVVLMTIVTVIAVAAVLVLVVVESFGYLPELKNFTSVHSVAERLLHLHNIYILPLVILKHQRLY